MMKIKTNHSCFLTPEELVGVLNMLGVPFLVGPKRSSFSPMPEALLVMLANQPDETENLQAIIESLALEIGL